MNDCLLQNKVARKFAGQSCQKKFAKSSKLRLIFSHRNIICASLVSVPGDRLHPNGCDDSTKAAKPLHDDDVRSGSASSESSCNPAWASPNNQDVAFC